MLLLASTYRTRWIKRATLAGWVSIAFVVFLYLASWVAFFTWNRQVKTERRAQESSLT